MIFNYILYLLDNPIKLKIKYHFINLFVLPDYFLGIINL